MPVINKIYYAENINESHTTPPIVLIHGAGGSHLSWPPDLRRFTGKNVYAVDLPGHGKSSGHGEQSLAVYADHIAAWMTELGLYRALVIGHSMGGGIAMELALRYPHLTTALGLFATGARLPVNESILTYTQNQATFPSALEIIRRHSFGPDASERLVELAMKRFAEQRSSVLHNDLHACNDFNISDRLAEIRRPTLVLCGSEDRMTPLRFSQYLASKLEKSQLQIVKGAGHMVMLEKSPETAEYLADFIKDLKSSY